MKVTILIVNYKNWTDTIECLESVLKCSYKDVQIVVVDNSPDTLSINNLIDWANGKTKVKETLYPTLVFPEANKPLNYIYLTQDAYLKKDKHYGANIIFVKAKTNNGFAAANNIVLNKLLQQPKLGNYVFLLNNDTVIPTQTITNLVNSYKGTNIGIAGCTLIEYYDSNKIQSVGGVYNQLFGTTKQVLEGLSVTDFNNKVNNTKIDYPAGAAMFLSIDVLQNIGILCEDYFLYYEELDWVKRASMSYKTTYFKNCLVYHKGGVSIGSNKKSYIADKFSIVNRINFAKKHNKKYLIMVYLGAFLSIFKRVLSGQFTRALQLTKAIFINEA